MNTDFEKQSGQRKSFLLVSGVAVAVCLFVAALVERRRLAASTEAARRARSFQEPTAPERWSPAGDAFTSPADTFSPAGPAGDPVWEDTANVHASDWAPEPVADQGNDAAPFGGPSEVASFASLDQHEFDAHVEPEVESHVTFEPEPQVEVEPWQQSSEPSEPPVQHGWEPAPQIEAEVESEPQHDAWAQTDESEAQGAEPVAEQPAPAVDSWFGSYTPRAAWQAPAESTETPEHYESPEPVEPEVVAEAEAEVVQAEVEPESVIELPPVNETPASESDPKRIPPPRLRRFMGTGATVLVLGLVLGAGILASGATADSTSDPATVPDAVATTAVLPDVLADTTSTDTTATDTTTTDTTTTDTTTTDTTTTATTTTDTTTTPTTTTDTTTTDTTATTTTPVDPATTTVAPPPPPPTDTTPVAPPPSDPATVPAAPAAPDVAPPADPVTPDVAPVPTPPVTPTTPAKPKTPVKPKAPAKPKPKHAAVKVPAKAVADVTPDVGKPASKGAPVVTLASGADPFGSILSANSVIPAVDASLLPTPAEVSFYVQAAKPLPVLPTLKRIDHPIAQRLVAAGRRGKVGWTVLAAVARLESNLGGRSGPLAGRRLPTSPTGDGLAALAAFLHTHGAKGNPLAPASAKKALTLYFDGSTRKADRAIALAALYGALGPAGMQHGVRAETARLQRRVLKDKRVHLTVAGRSDIRHGRVDPRVLVTLEYLANSFHKVGISDLVSGGALFSRSGSVSAHLYGRAADVASLHGKIVRGHQGPGTLTEQAIRKLLLLPKSLRPRQVISLMDVDGPTGNHGSFALPDHYDRIQIDY